MIEAQQSYPAKKPPRFCPVCGETYQATSTEHSGGFDPMTGDAQPAIDYQTLECSFIAHPKYARVGDADTWERVK